MNFVEFPKVSYKTNFELVAFRHRFFSKANKQNADYLLTHQHIIKNEAHRFFYLKRKTCEYSGYQIQDIVNYCRVWCVNLFGYLFKEALLKPIAEQEKILRFCLKQELGRLSQLIYKKNQRELHHLDTTDSNYLSSLEKDDESIEERDISTLSHSVFFNRWEKMMKKPWVRTEVQELALSLLEQHQKQCKTCLRKKNQKQESENVSALST